MSMGGNAIEALVSDGARLAALLAACAVLSSLELLVPLFRYRPGWLRRALPNLALAAAALGLNLALASVTAAVAAFSARRDLGLFAGARTRPWLLLPAGIVALDLFAYFAHVLLHKLPAGWKFHRVHHSEPEVDVTTAFRQHPGETLWRFLWQTLGVLVFGLPFPVVPVYVGLSAISALLEHANVRMNPGLDRRLRRLLVTPDMHKVHHSRAMAQTDSNYSNIFSVWDRLFRTYTRATELSRLRYGLEGFDDRRRQQISALIVEPFRNS